LILGVCATAAMLACASAPVSDEQSAASQAESGWTQELESVDVQSVDGETVITLVGLDDPAYTVDREGEQNILVMELPGVSQPSASLFDALSESSKQISVYDGLVDMVSTSTFDGGGEPVTRVEVTFASPADYEVVPSSDGLALRLTANAAMAEASEEAALEEAEAMPLSEETDLEVAVSDEPALDSAPADPWAEAEALAAAGDAAALGEPAPMEDEAPLSEDAFSGEESVVLTPVASDPATALEAIAVTTTEAGVLLHLEADGILGTAESFTIAGPDRLVVDLPGIQSKVAEKQISVGSDWVVRVRVGAHPDKLRVVLDGGPNSDGFQGRRLLPASNGLFLTIGSGADLDGALAAAVGAANGATQMMAAATETDIASELSDETATPEASDAAWDEMAVSDTPSGSEVGEMAAASSAATSAEIYGLQYDRDAKRDRIAVLSDQVIDFEVMTPDSETVVISIRDAVIAAGAGERITPEAGGPISLVTSFQQPDVPQSEVRVVMRRAPGLEPQVTRRGSLLFVDFENTGVAAAPPPAFIPGEPTRSSGEQFANRMEVGAPTDDTAMAMASGMTVEGAIPASLGDAEESHTALPEFDEPTGVADVAMLDDEESWSTPPQAAGSPASLEPPAAVDMLEEGSRTSRSRTCCA
jgi:hypothetical protein